MFVTALLRDAKGEANGDLPLTLVVKRPDGVEYKRAIVADQGLGGRAFAVPLLSGAAPGKWAIDAYADPKAGSIGHAEFLLEDYVPERLDFAVKPAKTAVTPGEPIDFSLDARFLYGAPAAGLDVTGAVRLEAVAGSEIAGYPGYVGGLTDDEFTAVEEQFTDKVQTDAKGHADLSVDLPEGKAAKPLEAKIIVDVAELGGRTVERVATLPVRAKGVTIGVKKDFDEGTRRGRHRDLRGDRRRARRRAQPRARASSGRSTRSTTTTNGSIPTDAGATSRSSPRRESRTGRSTSPPTRRRRSARRSAGAAIGST